MQLIIAEKPELADAIASAFPKAQKVANSYYDCGQTKITWCYGHMLALKDPEEYDSKYAKWSMADLPIAVMIPWQKKVIEGKHKQVSNILKLIEEAKIIVNAGDCDEEGQFLIDEVIHFAGKRTHGKPIKRLLVNDNSLKAVQKALANLKDNREFKGMSDAAEARSVADQLFGYNMTRAYTLASKSRSKTPLSVGRVQTPILGLIVRRDLEKAAHIKSYYYDVATRFQFGEIETAARYLIKDTDPIDENKRLIDQAFALAIVQTILHQKALVKDKKTEPKKQAAPLPYNLLKLQVDCAKQLDLDIDMVQQITQDLRTKYKLITYNRSSCQYLNDERHAEAPDVLHAIATNLGEMKSAIAKANPNFKSRAFNNSKVGAHHAIIPTETVVDFRILTENERNVYQLIARQYLAQFYPLYTYEQTTILIECQGYLFVAASIKVQNLGWKVLYQDPQNQDSQNQDEENETGTERPDCEFDLNSLEKGRGGMNITAEVITLETKPKPHYTNDTLLLDLTRVAKYVKNEDLKKVLIERDKGKDGEYGGIGTPATRSEIIKTLYKRGFIEQKGKTKAIISTKLGQDFYNALPDSVKYPDMTAVWHEQQKAIESGHMSVTDFLKRLDQFIAKEIHELKTNPDYIKSFTQITDDQEQTAAQFPCPKCGSNLRKIKGKEGMFWGCSGYPSCRATYPNGKNKPMLEGSKPQTASGSKKKETGTAKKTKESIISVFMPHSG